MLYIYILQSHQKCHSNPVTHPSHTHTHRGTVHDFAAVASIKRVYIRDATR